MIQEIWNKLSTIDVNKDTETKGEFTYLPWNYAVDYIMKYTPSLENFDFDFLHYTDSNGMVKDYIVAPDGSCSVECVVDINGIKRKMYLAVTDFKNRPIKNPSCNDINNTKMRCLTKCIATGYGLGWYIYKGEGLPQEEFYTEEQTAEFAKLIEHECFKGKKNTYKDKLRKSNTKTHYQSVLDEMELYIEFDEILGHPAFDNLQKFSNDEWKKCVNLQGYRNLLVRMRGEKNKYDSITGVK